MTYFYLATPYTKYPEGRDAAHKAACRQAARILQKGISVFCPIAHTHFIAEEGDLITKDLKFWLEIDQAFMSASIGLIFCLLPSWEISNGMREELNYFEYVSRAVFYLEPDGSLDEIVNYWNLTCKDRK